MIKKCIGCGIPLQTENENDLGYTPKLENDLCARCFKLKHYGNKIDEGKNQNNTILLEKINKNKCHVLFITDFLNINNEIIDTYKKIKNSKNLVINKSDIIPQNIIVSKLLSNIKKIYKIDENIILSSSKNNKLDDLYKIINKYDKVLFCGYTNMGKSSLINKITKTNLTVSNKRNTTQEFIKMSYEDKTIIDAPGFINSYIIEKDIKNTIRPITYQMKNKYYLNIEEIKLAFNKDVNLTIYIDNNIRVEKRKIKETLNYEEKINSNCDILIKGIGFIKVKGDTDFFINISKDRYEIRPSIVGGNYE